MAVLSMYGYAKTDIVGKNISVLVPEPMATVHQTFMINFVETGKEVIGFKMLYTECGLSLSPCGTFTLHALCIVTFTYLLISGQNIVHQTRTVFGRHHSGYIFPMLLCVKPMESTTEFVGMVKQLNGEDDYIMFSSITNIIQAATQESMLMLGVRSWRVYAS
jgi:hypothetical protein